MAKKASSNYQLLVQKLDQFIRKYYVNQIIRGGLYSLGLVLVVFLLFNFLEHEYYFEKGVRKVLFGSFIGISLLALGLGVFRPLLNYFRLGKVISHEQAALIIGDHFQDVRDKLLNILQLKKQAEGQEVKALIEASINQKSESLKLVPFKSAIDLSKNRKYLRYALPPFLLLILVLFAAPSIIKDSTHRIIHNNTAFEKAAPFQFVIDEDKLEAVQYEDLLVNVNIEGDVLPAEVFVELDNYQYRLKKVAPDQFSYVFKNLQKSVDFNLFSGDVRSKDYSLSVLEKPNITNFDVWLNYPSYTAFKDEGLNNTGDLVVPEGTTIRWNFDAIHTEEIKLRFSGEKELEDAKRDGESSFSIKKYVRSDKRYIVYPSNEVVSKSDSISYRINVIKDQYPSISVQQFQDSIEQELLYFIGAASDDYGIDKITFNYQHIGSDQSISDSKSQLLKGPSSKEAQYDYAFDLSALELKPGDQFNYYFEVFDNDRVNGSKSSRTNLMSLVKPTVEEFKEMEDENEEDIKATLEESLKESKELQKELQKLREKMLQEKEMTWQQKRELEELLKKQKDLQEQLQQAKDKFEENLMNQDEFSEQQEEVLEEQQQLQEMFEELMDEEMQNLMEQIQELLEELDKEDAIKMVEEFEMDEQSMENQMERLLELFKQLEVEKELQETISELEELAEKEEELSEKTSDPESDQEELKKEQEDINEAFEGLEEKLKELEQKNDELQYPKDIPEDAQEQMDDIQEDLEQSQDELEQQENQKASKSQKSAAQKMKKMAGAMQSSMEAGEMAQMEEDLQALRQLLENLVTLSFDQESLISKISRTNVNTPRYGSLVQEQFKIKDEFKIVEDSLNALSQRVSQIETFVIEKVGEVKFNLGESIEQLEERQKPNASQNQRFTMKNLNDLALMLSDAMNNMQQEMAGMMSGSQMCKKPGGQGQGKSGNQPMNKITERQEKLSGEMKKMMDGKQKGQGGDAKSFAETAAKQAAIRKALQEMMQNSQEQGNPAQHLQEIIDQMDQNETDLVNKRLNNEMIKRQQDILTRLLDAENAERQREYDNKRKAEVASQKEKKLPPSLEKYLKEREAEIDMFKSVSPSLKPYYKNLVEEYYRALKKDSD